MPVEVVDESCHERAVRRQHDGLAGMSLRESLDERAYPGEGMPAGPTVGQRLRQGFDRLRGARIGTRIDRRDASRCHQVRDALGIGAALRREVLLLVEPSDGVGVAHDAELGFSVRGQ